MNPCAQNRSAFTLIEMVVVVALIAVLSALAVPALLGSHEKSVLRSETQRLYDTARYAQRMAVIKQREIRLVLVGRDDEHGGLSSYRLELASDDLDATESYTRVRDGAVKPVVLPERVRLLDVKVSVAGPADAPDRTAMRFFPDGSSDGGVILVGSDARVRSVVVEPATGRVESVPRRVEAVPGLREDLDA